MFHKHIGLDRYSEQRFLRQRAIVFTTYATLATEVRRGASFLSNINWFRIVLDEGIITLHRNKTQTETDMCDQNKRITLETAQRNNFRLSQAYLPRIDGVLRELLFRTISKI